MDFLMVSFLAVAVLVFLSALFNRLKFKTKQRQIESSVTLQFLNDSRNQQYIADWLYQHILDNASSFVKYNLSNRNIQCPKS